MPAKDVYHAAVRNALIKDGWTITHDPYTLSFGGTDVYVDLGAERPIAAEKAGRRIAVEVKSFLGRSNVRDLEVAVGQYVFYRALLARSDRDRHLYLAVPEPVSLGILSEPIARPVLDDVQVSIVVFEPVKEVILKWIPSPNTGESSAT